MSCTLAIRLYHILSEHSIPPPAIARHRLPFSSPLFPADNNFNLFLTGVTVLQHYSTTGSLPGGNQELLGFPCNLNPPMILTSPRPSPMIDRLTAGQRGPRPSITMSCFVLPGRATPARRRASHWPSRTHRRPCAAQVACLQRVDFKFTRVLGLQTCRDLQQADPDARRSI